MSTTAVAKRVCSGTNAEGGPCARPPMKGATVCYKHGGNAPATRRKAIVRAEVEAWGVNDDLLDPGLVLLRLVAQSARRAEFYASLLAAAYQAADDADQQQREQEEDEDLLGVGDPEPARVRVPAGVRALIGKKFTVTPDGDRVEVSEAIRGLVLLETQERKLCADFASKAITAGLAERQVRIAEQQGTAIIAAITIALDRAGLIGPARLEAQNAAADYLDSLDVS